MIETVPAKRALGRTASRKFFPVFFACSHIRMNCITTTRNKPIVLQRGMIINASFQSLTQYKNIGLPSTLRTLGRYCSVSYNSSTSTRFNPLVMVLMGMCV